MRTHPPATPMSTPSRTIHLAATVDGIIIVALGNTADEAATIAAADLRKIAAEVAAADLCDVEPEPFLAVSMTGTPHALRRVLLGMEISEPAAPQLARVGLGRDVDTDGLDLPDLDVDDGESATA